MAGYFDRLGARARLTGALTTLEQPRTIVWVVIAWTWGSAVNTTVIALIFFAFSEPEAGWASVLLAVLFASCWFVFVFTGSVGATFALAIGGSVSAVTYSHLVVGGYANSGAFFFWGVGVAVAALLTLPRGWAVVNGVYWIVAAILFGFAEESLAASRSPVEPGLASVMFSYTMTVMTAMLIPVMAYLLSRITLERERSERLLLNVLPRSIAQRLKERSGIIADNYTECTVLFADIVGFTSHTRHVPPERLIDQLNAVFSKFDELTERRGAQKIKTIGDGYMAVAGVPEPREDHLEVICRLALDMIEAVEGLTVSDLGLRIGIDTGPAVAGIIGTSRFSYDLWGATVNLASRMESYGEPGKIQVSRAVRDRASHMFDFEPAGTIDMKGVGPNEAFYLTGVNQPRPTSRQIVDQNYE